MGICRFGTGNRKRGKVKEKKGKHPYKPGLLPPLPPYLPFFFSIFQE